MDFFFLEMRLEKIGQEFEQVRDVFSMKIMVNGIEEIIEFGQQTLVLLVDVRKASLPFRIPYELAHSTSFRYGDTSAVTIPAPTS
jgi:hypothetical protein